MDGDGDDDAGIAAYVQLSQGSGGVAAVPSRVGFLEVCVKKMALRGPISISAHSPTLSWIVIIRLC